MIDLFTEKAENVSGSVKRTGRDLFSEKAENVSGSVKRAKGLSDGNGRSYFKLLTDAADIVESPRFGSIM